MINCLPRNWRKMSEKEKNEFINYGEQIADRVAELHRRGYVWKTKGAK